MVRALNSLLNRLRPSAVPPYPIPSPAMAYTTLGKTGLQVSVIGLGGGGASRLGLATGHSSQEAIALMHRAAELGINLFDTAVDSSTELVMGKAIAQIGRDRVILSTKVRSHRQNYPISPQDVRRSLEQSLQTLRTDYIDIYHLASVQPGNYQYTATELVPVLLQLRDEGKIRFLGISEKFDTDTRHNMLARAVEDNCWDVMMVGFNLLNPSARQQVLPHTLAQHIGVIGMFAVRRALSQPQALQNIIQDLKQQGLLPPEVADHNPLGFLVHPNGAHSLQDAAYRFCRYEPGIHTTLMGTGSITHLEANIASVLRPPLPTADQQRLASLFGNIDMISGH